MSPEEEYQSARARLETAVSDPNVPDQVIRGLHELVLEHEKAAKPIGTESHSIFGEAISGQGGENLDPGASLERHLGNPIANEQRGRLEDSAAMAIKRQKPDPMTTSVADLEEAGRAGHEDDPFVDQTLPSASGVKEIFRPPTFTPAEKLQGHPIAGMRAVIPAFAGGEQQWYREPAIQQFRRDMGQVLGPKALTADENSPEYKQYADAQWAKVYDQAQASGTPIVRHRFAPSHGGIIGKAADSVVGALDTGMTAVGAAAQGAGKGLTFGAANHAGGDDVAGNLQRAGEEFPIAEGAGNFVGSSLNPLFRGISAVGGKLVPDAVKNAISGPVGKTITGMAGSAGVGAAGGAMGSLGTDAIDAATDSRPWDTKDALSRAEEGAESGAAFGALAHAAGQGVGALHGTLRGDPRLGPYVRRLEDAGGEVGGVRGVRRTPEMKAVEGEAGLTGEDPEAVVAGRLLDPLPKQARENVAVAKADDRMRQNVYRDANEHTTAYLGPFVEKLLNERAALTGPEGKVLPGKEPIARIYDRYLNGSGEYTEGLASPKVEVPFEGGLAPSNGDQTVRESPVDKLAARAASRIPATDVTKPNLGSETPSAKSSPGMVEATAVRAHETDPDDELTGIRKISGSFAPPPMKPKTPGHIFDEGVDLDTARRMGVDVDAVLSKGGLSPDDASNLRIQFDPKRHNPRQLDQLIDGIDALMKEGTNGKPDPALVWMSSEARKIRDQFPGHPILGNPTAEAANPSDPSKPTQLKNYSAFQHNSGHRAAEQGQALGLAGVRGDFPETLTAEQIQQLRGHLLNFGDPKRGLENRATERLASEAGPEAAGDLRLLGGMKGASALEKSSTVLGGGMGEWRRRILTRGRLMADPAMEAMAGSSESPGSFSYDPNKETVGKGTGYLGQSFTHVAGKAAALRGGGAGRGAAGAIRGQKNGFVGPDGNGRSVSDDEAERLRLQFESYQRLMGQF